MKALPTPIAILIVLSLIAVFGAAAYFSSGTSASPEPGTVTTFSECEAAGYPIGESYPRQCWTPDGKHFVEDIEENIQDEEPSLNSITISGEITCLPKIGTGEQTLECAIGLKGDDGKFYALKNLFELDSEYKFSQTGMRVTVSGVFSPEEMRGPDGNRYDIAGAINLTSIKKASQ